MLGAIIGDIVGSIYEFDNIKTKDFPLFEERCFFTDDSVMTIAVADAIMKGGKHKNYIESMLKFGHLYPDAGYGGRFYVWLNLGNVGLTDIYEAAMTDSYYERLNPEDTKPYNSWGNGSAMRVSPCGWIAKLSLPLEDGLKETENAAKISAEVTHNHPEGIKGAQATAAAIFYMRVGKSKNAVNEYKGILKKYIEEKYEYNLSQTLDDIRPNYKFNASCQGTVPQAIISFLESKDFEDAIRNAISLGGDSDTLAAITGSIAEAAYGIPEDIKKKALSYLDTPLKEIYEKPSINEVPEKLINHLYNPLNEVYEKWIEFLGNN